MSNEKNEPSKSAKHGKPKYVFLDKFERYKVHTDTVISGLQEDHIKTKKLLYEAEKNIRKINIGFSRLALACVFMVIMIIVLAVL